MSHCHSEAYLSIVFCSHFGKNLVNAKVIAYFYLIEILRIIVSYPFVIQLSC